MSKDKGASKNGERAASGTSRGIGRAVRPRATRTGVKAAAASVETPAAADTSARTDEDVRVRAYYLYLERQGHSFDPLADWLQAEREMTGPTSQAAD